MTLAGAIHGQTASQPSVSSNAAAQASLNRLVAKYKSEISRNPAAQDLASLARQINAAAKALGQHVTLPKASDSTTDTETGASSGAPASGAHGVDLQA